MPGPTAQIAEFAAAYRYETLPSSVAAKAREIVLDTIGAMVLGAGIEYTAVSRVAALARDVGGPPQCTIIGYGFQTDLLSAALVNGVAGYAADVEGAGIGRQHAAAVLVPTILTVGEYTRASGRMLVAALALGYEVAARIDDAAATERSYPHSFHPSAVFGHFGAVAAAGHLFGLSPDGFERALGLAGLTAGGLIKWIDDPSEDSRPLVIGNAVQLGVRAALLAARGFGGPRGILDPGGYDLYDALSGEAHVERLTANLGTDHRILGAGGYKRHPCCGDIHAGIDALLSILEEHDLAPERIARIVHRVHPNRARVIDGNPLKSHCAQYILAVAAVERRIDSDVILRDRRESDRRVAELFGRVELVADEELARTGAHQPAIVELTTTDGRVHRQRVDHFRGSRENPMTPEELRAKYFDLAGRRLGHARAEEIAGLVDKLETLPNIGRLIELLSWVADVAE
jgi:2-methylcitrate dehydratase PrpD